MQQKHFGFVNTASYLTAICEIACSYAVALADFVKKNHTFPTHPMSDTAAYQQIQQNMQAFAYRCYITAQTPVFMPLYQLIAKKQLPPAVVHTCICCIAWELDATFRQHIRSMPSFGQTKFLTLELVCALQMVCAADMPTPPRWAELQPYCMPQKQPHLLDHLRLHPVLLAFLLGHQPPKSEFFTYRIASQAPDPVFSSTVYVWQGVSGSGKKYQIAQAPSNVLFCDCHMLHVLSGTRFAQAMQEICLTALVYRCRVCFFDADDISEPSRLLQLCQALHAQQTLVLLTIYQHLPPLLAQSLHYKIQTPPAFSAEAQQKLLCHHAPTISQAESKAISELFTLSPAQTIAAAKTLDFFRPQTQKEKMRLCFTQCGANLHTLAEQIPAHFTWADLVLPKDLCEQIRQSCFFVRYRQQVYETWGLAKRISYGRGLNILFSGPPGTGKTMLAQVIANELQLELYRIDLSSVVSKYIGETEKNLEKIFDEAQKGSCILFFDEMDALFGKRSETKDAHDKYANLETAYLLQRLEQYDGVVLMATNYFSNIDEAFLRRIHFVFHIPFPDAVQRRELWKKAFPAAAPLAADVDFDFLSTQFMLSGARIKQIALSAAVFAAAKPCSIDMYCILRALIIDLQKQNHTFVRQEFGKYQHILDFLGEYENDTTNAID